MQQGLLDYLQRLAKCAFRFHRKTPHGVIGEKKELILLGDLNCDLLSETISKSKHLVHIYNTYGLRKLQRKQPELQLKLIP